MADFELQTKRPRADIKRVDSSPDGFHSSAGYEVGSVENLDDKVNREFYGSSLSDGYRMKSELVATHLQEIGMGRYVSQFVKAS